MDEHERVAVAGPEPARQAPAIRQLDGELARQAHRGHISGGGGLADAAAHADDDAARRGPAPDPLTRDPRRLTGARGTAGRRRLVVRAPDPPPPLVAPRTLSGPPV